MSALPEWLQAIGAAVGQWILSLAGLLRHEAAPGLVSLFILVFFAVAVACYLVKARSISRAIFDARQVLGDGRTVYYDQARFLGITEAFQKWEVNASPRLLDRILAISWRNLLPWNRKRPRPTPRQSIAEAWREFAETMNQQRGLFNTVRPREFFDREFLHMEHRFFAQLPALFVSVGLLLTFLGLVAALDQTREILEGTGSDNEGLRTLLQVAGAKFIMSLTGLFCSILFGLLFRFREATIDEGMHGVCADIERGLEYRSADSFLLEKILDVLEEQKTQLQTFSTELVAQVARPLREEIPQAISQSIQEAMTPSLEQFDRNAGQGLEQMVNSVTSSMSGSIHESAQALNETMQKVAGELDSVASRLDNSAASMGGQVGEAVAALSGEIGALQKAMAESSREATNTLKTGARDLLASMDEALQAIRNSTCNGADGIDQAVAAMTRTMNELARRSEEASQTVARENKQIIEAATQRAADGLDRSAATVSREMERMAGEIGAVAREAASALQADLLDRLEKLPAAIRDLNDQMVACSHAIRSVGQLIHTSAGRMEDAHETLSSSSRALREAAGPVGSSVQRIEKSNRLMEAKVKATANTLESETREMTRVVKATANALESGAREMTREMTHVTIQTLRSTAETIRNAQAGCEEARKALELAVGKFKDLVERFVGLDQRLGEAWTRLGEDVKVSLDEFSRFEKELNQEFARALRKLQEVVEQIEPFTPRP